MSTAEMSAHSHELTWDDAYLYLGADMTDNDICEIDGCPHPAMHVVETLRDLVDRDEQALLHVCAGHREQLDGDNTVAVDVRNLVIVRPDRKPADWCLPCGGVPCRLGYRYAGIVQAHEERR